MLLSFSGAANLSCVCCGRGVHSGHVIRLLKSQHGGGYRGSVRWVRKGNPASQLFLSKGFTVWFWNSVWSEFWEAQTSVLKHKCIKIFQSQIIQSRISFWIFFAFPHLLVQLKFYLNLPWFRILLYLVLWYLKEIKRPGKSEKCKVSNVITSKVAVLFLQRYTDDQQEHENILIIAYC